MMYLFGRCILVTSLFLVVYKPKNRFKFAEEFSLNIRCVIDCFAVLDKFSIP